MCSVDRSSSVGLRPRHPGTPSRDVHGRVRSLPDLGNHTCCLAPGHVASTRLGCCQGDTTRMAGSGEVGKDCQKASADKF